MFGGLTPKPLALWSNSKLIGEVHTDKPKNMMIHEGDETVRSFIDVNGKRRCTGNKEQLKARQSYPREFAVALGNMAMNAIGGAQ